MKRAICIMTLVPVALIAGCGGGDDSTPETPIVTPTVDTPAKLSKEQFITGADGVCAEVNAALGSLSSSTTTSSTSAAGQRADLYEGMIERIRALGNPDDQASLDEFFSAGDDLVAAEKDAEEAAQDGDDTALTAAQSEAATAGSTFASAASSYGFEDCGQGPTTPTTTAPATEAPVTPVAPVTPAAPVEPVPSGGAGTDTGTAGGGTTGGGSTGGTSGGSGGVGPG